MSEPKTVARRIERVAPGLVSWHLQDDRIRFRSDGHAVTKGGASVLIDPLPLTEAALATLGTIEAICLTAACHQRSAWRYRARSGASVYAPAGAIGLEERPDESYRKGAVLPGGLLAVHAPGPSEAHFAFHLPRGRGTLLCADLLINDGRRVRFVDASYQDEPERTRRSVRGLLRRAFGILCFDHGAPLVRGARDAVRRALEKDARP